MTTPDPKKFDVADLPTTAVTVFVDRAEVKRKLKTDLKKGLNEVVITKLTELIREESIRVDGHGNATIAEVLYRENVVKKDEQLREEEKATHQKMDELEKEVKQLQREENRLRTLREVLDGVAKSIKCGGQVASSEDKNEKKDRSQSAFGSTKAYMDGLDDLFKKYGVETHNAVFLDDRLAAIEKKRDELRDEMGVLERKMHTNRENRIREISILLDAKEAGPVELIASYLVSNASWMPSYDVRVYETENKMTLLYYGRIKQKTGETWTNAKLYLSTATPSVGGQIPELETWTVGLRKHPVGPELKLTSEKPMGFLSAKVDMDKSIAFANTVMAGPSIQESPMTVHEHMTTTSFEIARLTTVPSDNDEHKVTIAMIDLRPNFKYETVPVKSTSVFLKARVKNESDYPLLAGPTSIFWENSFVANGQLKGVSPKEEFECSLGVDPAVRVEYNSVEKLTYEIGWIMSRSTVVMSKQKIKITNTHEKLIDITVVDRIPLSTDEKVKVTLIEPQSSPIVSVNDRNKIEWTLSLQPQESKTLVMKYEMTHPKGEELDFNERN